MSETNRAAQRAVDDSMLERVKSSLPSIEQFGASLKYGTFISVSPQGPEVVALIRQIPTRKGAERNALLRRLLTYSRQGVPEAQTFSGFVYEFGLFGAPRNLELARSFYQTAAARRYQPALLNLANMAYFGIGEPNNTARARELIQEALQIGNEASSRVCGLASFIEYRRGDRASALKYGRGCFSALSNIPNAAYGNDMPMARRIKLLRDSIGTGAPDGYRWLEEITQKVGPDKEQLYCKYRLVNRFRDGVGNQDVKALARTCYGARAADTDRKSAESSVQGIVSFAMAETRALDQLRRVDHFRHASSVPYLPFRQLDVDLYAPIMKEAK